MYSGFEYYSLCYMWHVLRYIYIYNIHSHACNTDYTIYINDRPLKADCVRSMYLGYIRHVTSMYAKYSGRDMDSCWSGRLLVTHQYFSHHFYPGTALELCVTCVERGFCGI